MKLLYTLYIFICLFGLFSCNGDVWVDKELDDSLFKYFCRIFTDPNTDSSPPVIDEKQNFKKCDGQLKKGWVEHFPVSTCLVEINNIKSLFIMKWSKGEHYEYPEIQLNDKSVCTRFIPKQITSPTFYVLSGDEDENIKQAQIQHDIIEAYSLMRKMDYATSAKKLKIIIGSLTGEGQKYLSEHVNESLAHIQLMLYRNALGLYKHLLKKELLVFANAIKLNKESFFKNFVLYSIKVMKVMKVDGNNEELVRDLLLKMAMNDKGDSMNIKKFVENGFYENAVDYFKKDLDFENKYYDDIIKPKILDELLKAFDSRISQLDKEREGLERNKRELSNFEEEELKKRKELILAEYQLEEEPEATKGVDTQKEHIHERIKELEDTTKDLDIKKEHIRNTIKELEDTTKDLDIKKEHIRKRIKELEDATKDVDNHNGRIRKRRKELGDATKNVDNHKEHIRKRGKELEDAISKLNEYKIKMQQKRRRKLLKKRRT
jgi:methyl-accepting chemotaxis protein